MKVPVFPLHTWLPDAHTEAPTAGSVLLAAVLLKVGAYGLIRFNMALFPEASQHFATPIMVLAVIGIIYGAVCAIGQRDVKRLVAYSSVVPPRVRGAGALRAHPAGGHRRRAPDGEPRAGDRRAVPAGGHGVRPHATPAARRAGRARERHAVAAGLLPVRGVRVRRAARAQRLRRRVPGDRGHVRDQPLAGCRRLDRASCSARSTCCGPTSAMRIRLRARRAPRAARRVGPRGHGDRAGARPVARVRRVPAAHDRLGRSRHGARDRARRARHATDVVPGVEVAEPGSGG